MCLLQFSGHALERMGQYDLSYDDVYFATNHGTVMKDKPTGTEVQFLARDLSVCGAAQHINIVGVTVVIAPDDDTVVTVYRCRRLRRPRPRTAAPLSVPRPARPRPRCRALVRARPPGHGLPARLPRLPATLARVRAGRGDGAAAGVPGVARAG